MSDTIDNPHRRGLLARGTAAIAADDAELIALYRRWRAAEDAREAASDRAAAIRERLTRIYGEAPLGLTAARALWGNDPAFPVLRREIEESNRQGADSGDLADELFALDASSIAGVLVKVRIAIEWADPPSDETTYSEEIAIDALKNVERVLEAIVGRAEA